MGNEECALNNHDTLLCPPTHDEPFVLPAAFLLAPTAAFSFVRQSSVVSKSMHASVTLTPYLRPLGPSAGTSWRPALKCDSIMTPVMEVSPASSCSTMLASTFGWLLWFFCELPCEQSIYISEIVSGVLR